jgi:histone deacetylase HOS3
MERPPVVFNQDEHTKQPSLTPVKLEATTPSIDPSSSKILLTHHTVSTIFIQDACFQHRFIRSRDTSAVVERPERLRAVKLGLAAAVSHVVDAIPSSSVKSNQFPDNGADLPATGDVQTDDLTAALARMNLATRAPPIAESAIPVINSSASVDILNNPAVKFIHGDIDGDVYLEKLKEWIRDSQDKIMKGESEIPEDLSQGDLYRKSQSFYRKPSSNAACPVCPGSLDAIQGAIGTVCEAVDTVIKATRSKSDPAATTEVGSPTASRAFVAIRPPGHHCGEDTPSGFCFVNNVAIAAAHGGHACSIPNPGPNMG